MGQSVCKGLRSISAYEVRFSLSVNSACQKRVVLHFCGICRRQCHYEFNRVFGKPCVVFCAKPKEVDPIKLISLQQISVSIVLIYIINNSLLK